MIIESQNIEFKESWRDEYQKWICGFANAQGGTLYIGLRDNGEVCGVQDAKKLMEDIPNKVRDIMVRFEYPEMAMIQNVQDTIQKKLSKQQEAILIYLCKHPDATRKELVENIPDTTKGGIIYNLSRLQELELLKRVGGRKQGVGQIVEL